MYNVNNYIYLNNYIYKNTYLWRGAAAAPRPPTRTQQQYAHKNKYDNCAMMI